jgi:hypothetical protein
MHGSTSCSECEYDPCVCHRKPSDRPGAARIRKASSRHKQKRRKEFQAWLEDYHRVGNLLCGRSDAARIFRLLPIVAPANLLAAIRACEEDLQTLRDYWWVATGIADLPPAPWNNRERLALGAMLADLIPLTDDNRQPQTSKNYPLMILCISCGSTIRRTPDPLFSSACPQWPENEPRHWLAN